MKSFYARHVMLLLSGLFLYACAQHRQTAQYDPAPVDWPAYSAAWLSGVAKSDPAETVLPGYDEARATHYLDMVSEKWAEKHRCGTCHTNVPYLMVRPFLPGEAEGKRITQAVRSNMMVHYRSHIGTPTQAFATAPVASALAINDVQSGMAFSDQTRELFEFLWKIQEPDGSWTYSLDQMLPFLERDRFYVTMLVALGVGYLPADYLDTPNAKAGSARLRSYIRNNLPTSAHDKAVLLRASVRFPGLLTGSERRRYQRELLKLQNADGGWTLPALGTWARHDGAPNDPEGPSDGYATGMVALALCQSGYGPDNDSIKQASQWIASNQRISGRWYTRSTYSDRFQGYISNMGTGYALLALKACSETVPRRDEKRSQAQGPS